MRLRTLGTLALEGTDFSRPKPLLLLGYLALEGPQPRRHLAELFWPGAKDHMKSLTVALARLRQGAPGAVGADDKRVWTTLETDAGDLLDSLQRGDVRGAAKRYQGPFLDGVYLQNWGAELEEWVTAGVSRWRTWFARRWLRSRKARLQGGASRRAATAPRGHIS